MLNCSDPTVRILTVSHIWYEQNDLQLQIRIKYWSVIFTPPGKVIANPFQYLPGEIPWTKTPG